ncbi:5-formyltetrahydrofolate cyclo-ligase [Venturia canescens]|uniref:5-formyltetrahydrofolate cyclo-ligase n=1 Tax=Venturia canescens TaxID=32260 RepID=UPI001C9BE933|nr:5-formyltetrahydrofolate cyclo-ligase [Venturia canescens]
MVFSSLISRRTMATIKSAKSALRKEIQAAIEKIEDGEKKRQSIQVVQKLLALPQYKESKRISVYLSTKDEIDTLPILKDIFENKKEAFVPRYEGKKMCMVKLDSLEDYEKLPLTKWNIKQPLASDARDDALETGGLDLVILPGVAFTVTGKRCGHGMGYYDKFLQSCVEKQSKKPHLIAVAFNEQMRDDIPTSESDVLLDLIVTEKLRV